MGLCNVLHVKFNILHLIFIIFLLLSIEDNISALKAEFTRGAIIITIPGRNKLSEYVEWSCRSIYYSRDWFDMLIFHEGNYRIRNLKCADNAILIDLGQNGLSSLIADKLGFTNSSKLEIQGLLTNTLLHLPRYLNEIKPLNGYLFQDWLYSNYSHWSYSDPDVIWGNLTKFISLQDFNAYDVVTFSKTNDANKLYLRTHVSLLDFTLYTDW